MKTEKSESRFDCVSFKREVQLRIYNETKDMPCDERLAYFRAAAENGPFAEFWAGLPDSQPASSQSHLE